MKIVNQLIAQLRADDEKARTELFGPPPINPFTLLRSNSGLSLSQLAAYSQINEMAIRRAESGTYTNPLPALADYWISKGATNTISLNNDYHDFVDAQRARHRFYFGPDLRTDGLNTNHPFRQLRERRPSRATNTALPVGVVECSRALCVPLDTIQFFEKRYARQKSVPKVLKDALNQIGYPVGELTVFENTYKNWRETTLMESKVVFG